MGVSWSYGKLGKSSRESVSCFIFRVASRALLSPRKVSFFTFAASTLLRKLIRIYGSGKRFYFRVDHRPQKRTYRLSVAKERSWCLLVPRTKIDHTRGHRSMKTLVLLLRAKVPLVSSSFFEKCNFFILTREKKDWELNFKKISINIEKNIEEILEWKLKIWISNWCLEFEISFQNNLRNDLTIFERESSQIKPQLPT